MTQRDIARLARVSQTTVSLVLNNRADASARIPADTRDRVLKVIRETGYVADPLARRLQQQRNQILGVFTYESVFPSASADFYHPFLSGIEESAEERGLDLLLFTSAPVTDGRRRVFHANNRLRLADGSLLLGRHIPAEELSRLVAEQYPFVSVGRRDDPERVEPQPGSPSPLPSTPAARAAGGGGVVPYVGADYVSATATLTERASGLGHQQVAFVGPGEGAESSADRLRGFRQIAPRGLHIAPTDRPLSGVLDELLAQHFTAVFVEDLADADALAEAARGRGLTVPGDLSVVALGDASRPVPSDVDYSGFHIPRKEMGRQAVGLLEAILSGETPDLQQLLPCELVVGSTLAPPKGL
nr:LacI family DNA-binding transcriptional regulator [Kribbella italica]